MRTAPQVRDRAFGDEAISPRITRTPENYLVCRDAILSRCGQQLYHASEIGGADIEPDNDGWITVQRDAAEVFRPESLASFIGKPVVLGEHPDAVVNTGNIHEFAVGHVMAASAFSPSPWRVQGRRNEEEWE